MSAGIWWQQQRSLRIAAGRFLAVRENLALAADKLVCRGWAFSGYFEKFVPLGGEISGRFQGLEKLPGRF